MWYLSVMLIAISILSILFIMLVMRERRIFRSIISKIRDHPDVTTSDQRSILFLSYKSEVLQELDSLLEATNTEKFIVILSAPEWLVSQKRRKWVHHTVVYAKELGWEIEKVSIIQVKQKGITRIRHVVEYLENNHREGRGMNDGKHYASGHTRTLS